MVLWSHTSLFGVTIIEYVESSITIARFSSGSALTDPISSENGYQIIHLNTNEALKCMYAHNFW